MNTLRLDRAIKAFQRDTEAEVLKRIQFIILDILRRVTFYMPVDTGRARGGTQVTINEPAYNDPEILDPSGSATIEAGRAPAKTFKLGDVGYISNPVHYVPHLEEGTDRTAPVKMFARALSEAAASLE